MSVLSPSLVCVWHCGGREQKLLCGCLTESILRVHINYVFDVTLFLVAVAVYVLRMTRASSQNVGKLYTVH